MSNSFKIANSIGMINDDLIMEADKIVESRSTSGKPVYLRYAAAAAALVCVAGGAAVIAKTRTAPSHVLSSEVVDRDDSAVQGTQIDLNDGDTVTSNMRIVKMSEVHFNETSSPDVSGARLYFDPEKYDELTLDRQAVLEYYGKELAPAYIPDGLIPQRRSGMVTMFAEKSGKLIYDTVGLSYYHDYYEDGSPKLTDNVAATKGFSIEVSKLGMPFSCGCFSSVKDNKATCIGETEVLFGHYSMSYGPYTPETHEPSGYYDMYVAEFELDGISYRVITNQLERDEIVKIVSSIICGEDFTVEE